MVPEPLNIPLSSTLMPPDSGTLDPDQREISPSNWQTKESSFLCSLVIVCLISSCFFSLFSSRSLCYLAVFSSSAPVCDLSSFIPLQLSISFSLPLSPSFIPLQRAVPSLCSPPSHNSYWQERLELWLTERGEVECLLKPCHYTVFTSQRNWKYRDAASPVTLKLPELHWLHFWNA